ncbi:YbjN domain-containing protein [Oceanicola sp. S124]|uniref:YbjN domain-containing protein n=1 Tax=Oceanicola sp. S124 TaxID=1042378 RepID=UPI000255829C|nr:YbjN domain-containing protein [Oceanicola sp. S124]
MTAIRFAAACLALLPLTAQPVLAKSSGGLVSGAIGSALRAAGDNDSGVTAEAGLVSAADPAGMAQALQDLGYRAELDTDGVGDPMIRSASSGTGFNIYFYGCVENAGCDSIMLSSGFDLTEGLEPAKINAWNQESVVASAYLDDEGDPYLQHYILTRSGIPLEVFEYALGEWEYALGDFLEFIDW